MSDDDLIRRGDVFRVIHGVAEFNRDVVDAIRALPAVPPSPAERLARAAEFAALVASDLHPSESMGVAAWDEALAAYRAAPPDSTGAAPPAAEPAIFQKPGSSLDEGSVRCNNPEPAAQPFRHGRCCAEEPKEPAPCGTCGGSGNDPYTMTGEDGTKPCATCGGVGIVLDGPITHVTKHCPSCRPGGAA